MNYKFYSSFNITKDYSKVFRNFLIELIKEKKDIFFFMIFIFSVFYVSLQFSLIYVKREKYEL